MLKAIDGDIMNIGGCVFNYSQYFVIYYHKLLLCAFMTLWYTLGINNYDGGG